MSDHPPLPRPPADCATCANKGVLDGEPCSCDRGQFVDFVRKLKLTLLKGA